MKKLLNYNKLGKKSSEYLQATKCISKLMPGDRFHHDWIKVHDGKDHVIVGGRYTRKVVHKNCWGKPMRAKDS